MAGFMTPEQIYDTIEPCVLDAVSMDVTERRVRLDLHVVNGGTPQRYSLSFDAVLSFRLDRPSAVSWNHTELSEIIIERSKEGHWRFWAELWSQDAMEIIAERVLFDGSEVQGAA
jgi:hypothetical protein